MSSKFEDLALPAFLQAFNEVHHTSYVITDRPDQLNRETPDVDAWAQCPDRPPLAIEHTVLPSFAGAYEAGRVFVRYVQPLEAELTGLVADWFQVRVPHEALQRGVDWNRLAAEVRDWFQANAADAHPGLTKFTLRGIPGEFVLQRIPSDLHIVYMARTLPQGDFDEMLRASVADRLNHKYEELTKYQADGARTALVLESHDMSMINEQILTAVVHDVLRGQPRPGLDEIWLVWSVTSIPYVYCLAGPDAVRSAAQDRTERLILRDV